MTWKKYIFDVCLFVLQFQEWRNLMTDTAHSSGPTVMDLKSRCVEITL